MEHGTSYLAEKKVAKFISDIIGKENLIKSHFNNDYNTIKSTFNSKTGKNLNDLVTILNSYSKTKSFLFGRIYRKKYNKKIDNYIQEAKESQSAISPKVKNDFIPKCAIDYAKVNDILKDSAQIKANSNTQYKNTELHK